MFFEFWSRQLVRLWTVQSARPSLHRARLLVEALEERALLSGSPHHHGGGGPPINDNGNGVDAQRGYPLPPGKGPALDGSVGVAPIPTPVLPPMNGPGTGGIPTVGSGPVGGVPLSGPTVTSGKPVVLGKPGLVGALTALNTLLTPSGPLSHGIARSHHHATQSHHHAAHHGGHHPSLPPA
jgi:hypothetical protein